MTSPVSRDQGLGAGNRATDEPFSVTPYMLLEAESAITTLNSGKSSDVLRNATRGACNGPVECLHFHRKKHAGCMPTSGFGREQAQPFETRRS